MPNFTTSGSPTFNGDSTCIIDDTGPDRVQAPVSLFSPTQSWFAMRLAPTWAATDQPYGAGADMRVFSYRNGSDLDRIEILYKEANDFWQIIRTITAGGGAVANSTAQTFAANSHHTVIGAWDSVGTKISADGSTFTSTSGAAVPSLPNSVFEIGNRDDGIRAVKAKVFWVVLGTGTLSDADATTLDNFGDTDPTWEQLPGNPTLLWSANTVAYLTSPPPKLNLVVRSNLALSS